MVLKKCFAAICTCIACIQLSAQEYYDARWKPVHPDKAFFVTERTQKDGLWHKIDFFASTTKLYREGWYKDSACTIKHGEFLSYYNSGSLEYKTQYANNQRNGLSFSYYPHGMMRDSLHFKNDIPYGYCRSWYPTGDLMLEMQMDSLGSGLGLVIGFFDNGTMSFKGKMAKGLRKTGNWFYHHTNGNRACVLQYPKEDSLPALQPPKVKNDAFEHTYYDSTINWFNTICYNTEGMQTVPCVLENKRSEFRGGPEKWAKYLTTSMESLTPKLAALGQKVNYIACFIIQTDGKPANLALSGGSGTSLDKEIEQLFLYSGKWLPAMHNNRIIPYVHIQNLTLNARSTKKF